MDNLLSFNKNTNDGHGGRRDDHHKEMEEIAFKVFCSEKEQLMEEIKEMIYQAQYQAYGDALKDVLGALEYDIESVTRIGFEGCRDIFEDKKAQKFISDHIMQTIIKELKNKKYKH